MVYLYAITKHLDRPPLSLRGLDDAPLDLIKVNGLGAVVSRINRSSVQPTPKRLWRHEQVVEALMSEGTVLPFRFSTVFSNEKEAAQELREANAKYAGNLDKLNGCVELGLRVLRMGEVPGDRGSQENPSLCNEEKEGRTFDTALAAARLQETMMRRRDESLGEILNRALVTHAVDSKLKFERMPGMLIRAAYLVARESIVEMQNAVQYLAEQYPGLHFICTGPWPPYSFVQQR